MEMLEKENGGSSSPEVEEIKNEDMLRNLSYIMKDKHGNKIKYFMESDRVKHEPLSNEEDPAEVEAVEAL